MKSGVSVSGADIHDLRIARCISPFVPISFDATKVRKIPVTAKHFLNFFRIIFATNYTIIFHNDYTIIFHNELPELYEFSANTSDGQKIRLILEVSSVLRPSAYHSLLKDSR